MRKTVSIKKLINIFGDKFRETPKDKDEDLRFILDDGNVVYLRSILLDLKGTLMEELSIHTVRVEQVKGIRTLKLGPHAWVKRVTKSGRVRFVRIDNLSRI